MSQIILVLSILTSAGFVITIADSKKLSGQDESTILVQYQRSNNSDPEVDDSKDIVRLQAENEQLKLSIHTMYQEIEKMKEAQDEQRDSINIMKGGIYVFVPLLGVLNILGFISTRRSKHDDRKITLSGSDR